MTKKWMYLLATSLLTLFLAACQQEEANEAEADEATPETEETVEEETVTEEEETVTEEESDHAHDHDHAHGEMSEKDQQIYKGYFEDSDIGNRPLSNWAGDWQSVYPYLLDGTLDEVFEHKAEEGDMTAEEYKDYYTTGYMTDVDRIEIKADIVTFHKGDESVTGRYKYDGYEILTYEKGNRGVRFIYKQMDENSDAPAYMQFSDHIINDKVSHHYHLYFGDDRAALLEELENWPTYYHSDLTGEEIAEEMIAH
ncbi:metal-binding protein ZinT [Chryseomicrobium sp. FSL W7-1435]|uniref:ZinT family metal-binding protein n=1 Tax=Chryseomicrobium sp. FSL W7-1435 TaxID=2921704 RepID=UPI00315ABF36